MLARVKDIVAGRRFCDNELKAVRCHLANLDLQVEVLTLARCLDEVIEASIRDSFFILLQLGRCACGR